MTLFFIFLGLCSGHSFKPSFWSFDVVGVFIFLHRSISVHSLSSSIPPLASLPLALTHKRLHYPHCTNQGVFMDPSSSIHAPHQSYPAEPTLPKKRAKDSERSARARENEKERERELCLVHDGWQRNESCREWECGYFAMKKWTLFFLLIFHLFFFSFSLHTSLNS